jgi:GH25 family lysozyme M1 (1,4-beta-N-acetylmuramidase)
VVNLWAFASLACLARGNSLKAFFKHFEPKNLNHDEKDRSESSQVLTASKTCNAADALVTLAAESR